MADDLTLQTNSATGFAAGEVFATDNVADRHIQEVKLVVGEHGVNGGDFDGTSDKTLLASSARTATANSTDQTNVTQKGVLLYLNVTVSGGSGDTLSVKIQGKDPISGAYADLADFGVLITGTATGLKTALLYPTVSDADFGGIKALAGNLPHTWRAVVTPSDATSWTYSLGASPLI